MSHQNKEHTVWTISPSTQHKTQQILLDNFKKVPYNKNDVSLHAYSFENRQNKIPFLHANDHAGEVKEEGLGEQAFVAEMNSLKRF